MKTTLSTGVTGEATCIAEETASAAFMKSGTLAVFATPAMVALMEQAAERSVRNHLPEGTATVGTRMEVSHLSATPLGMTVRAQSTLTAVDGKRLTFMVEAFDEAGKIGEGIHERYIVDANRFMEKANAKRG